MKVKLMNVRVSFCHVFEKSAATEGGKETYNMTCLIPKDDAYNYQQLINAINEVYQKACQPTGKWKGVAPTVFQHPLNDGDTMKDTIRNPEFKNMFYITPKNEDKPFVVGRNLEVLTEKAQFYSGCYANVLINVYPYVAAGRKGIAFSLEGAQFAADGVKFSGGASISDFDALDPQNNVQQFAAMPQGFAPQPTAIPAAPIAPATPVYSAQAPAANAYTPTVPTVPQPYWDAALGQWVYPQ